MSERVVLSFSGSTKVTGRSLSGTAHAFGEAALLSGSNQYEGLQAGAFDKALETSDVRAFVEHDRRLILGRQSAGTLKLHADEDGLHYEIPELPDTTYANDLLESVKRGDVSEASFSFEPGEVEMKRAADGKRVRLHTAVKSLLDISPVTIPAFSGTNVQLRSLGMTDDEPINSQLVRARARASTKETQ